MNQDELEDLLEKADELNHCPEQVAILQEAVKVADNLDDIELAVDAREKLVTAAVFSGMSDVALATFSWILAKVDEDPNLLLPYFVLWKYKWIYGSLPNFPNISKEKIAEIRTDIVRRYSVEGFGEEVVHSSDALAGVKLGDRTAAERSFELWESTPRDLLSDCTACDFSSKVQYYGEIEEYEKAEEAFRHIEENELSCATVPKNTYSYLLMPLAEMGKAEKADEYHFKGLDVTWGESGSLHAIARHIEYSVRMSRLDEARDTIDRHWESILPVAAPYKKLFFYNTMVGFLTKFLASSSDRKLKIRLPDFVPVEYVDGYCQAAELLDWVQLQVNNLANQFNERNGNQVVSEFFRNRLDWMLKTD